MSYTYSAADYIINNDLEGAIERYKSANKRWSSHWWDTIVTIYQRYSEWANIYILNTHTHTIWVKSNSTNSKSKEKGNWCYWIEIYVDYELRWNKVGTTTEKDPIKRLTKLIKDGWIETRGCENLAYKIKRMYQVDEDLPAEGLESELRARLCAKYRGQYRFVKNDRFEITDENDEATIEEMDKWATDYGATVMPQFDGLIDGVCII